MIQEAHDDAPRVAIPPQPVRSPHPHSVSVVVPNYNYAHYLRERISGILAQTHPIEEVILLDDASTDDSAVVIEQIKTEWDKQLQVVLNTKNSGAIVHQWARGVNLAKGELVWIAEADDLADDDFLATTVRAFDDPEVVLSYCQSRRVDAAGKVLHEDYSDYLDDVDPDRWRRDYCRAGAGEIADALSVRNTIPNISAVVFKRAALSDVLAANLNELSSLRIAADWCCYLHLLQQGSIAYTARSLNSHRHHSRSVTALTDGLRHLQEIQQMQRLAARLVDVPVDKVIAGRLWYAACAEMAADALRG